jgi:hypothetical protein
MLTVIRKGYEVDLTEYGLDCLSFQVESLIPNHETNQNEGVDGLSIDGTTYEARTIYTRFLFKVDSYDEFHDKRDQVYKLFKPKNKLTLIDNRQPHKQWHVQAESDFIINEDESLVGCEFELEFISPEPFAEATKKTVTTASTNTLNVFNEGDEIVDGRKHDLVIQFTGQSDNLRIVNEQTGDSWQYFGTTNADDTIRLESVYAYKNDESIFKDTNYSVLTLEEGSNGIQIYGATGDYNIKFEFTPLYI